MDREQGIKAVIKIARDELIRRNIMKLIFEKVTIQLIHLAFNNERDEALEVIMDDINSFIEPLFILKNQILPGIYPAIY
jgi:uncharacterized protein YjaG (DUF416 family)